jgi:hypothetical protein
MGLKGINDQCLQDLDLCMSANTVVNRSQREYHAGQNLQMHGNRRKLYRSVM